MPPSTLQLAILVLMWLGYAVVHSTLASFAVKRRVAARWPAAMPAYRLAFNLLAVLLLVPPLWATHAWRGPLLWRWDGAWGWLADGLALAAVAGFAWSSRHYDMAVFGGLAQLRTREQRVSDGGRLTLSPLHRYVRHPWYALALLILWTRDMDAARLTGTVCISLYFWLGSLLEERKLLAEYGERYRRYRSRVPGLLPLPWRVLGKDEARALAAGADEPPRRDD